MKSQSTWHLFLISVFFPLSHRHEECGSQHSLLSFIPVSVELSKEQPGSVILGHFIDKKAENKQSKDGYMTSSLYPLNIFGIMNRDFINDFPLSPFFFYFAMVGINAKKSNIFVIW